MREKKRKKMEKRNKVQIYELKIKENVTKRNKTNQNWNTMNYEQSWTKHVISTIAEDCSQIFRIASRSIQSVFNHDVLYEFVLNRMQVISDFNLNAVIIAVLHH